MQRADSNRQHQGHEPYGLPIVPRCTTDVITVLVYITMVMTNFADSRFGYLSHFGCLPFSIAITRLGWQCHHDI